LTTVPHFTSIDLFFRGVLVMAQSLRRKPVLERKIDTEAEKQHEQHHAYGMSSEDAPALATPDYIKHRDKAIEKVVLFERVKQCETMTRDTLAVIEELKEVAACYREQGKRIFNEIETRSELMADVGKTCTELRVKIAVPASSDRPEQKGDWVALLNNTF
jgi:uncharacterized hydantoinase/oxoprolinase family protein